MTGEPRKCWAVTTGSYSDYRIECVFTNEEAARAFANELGKDYDVETFPLYDTPPAIRRIHVARIEVNAGQTLDDARCWDYFVDDWGQIKDEYPVRAGSGGTRVFAYNTGRRYVVEAFDDDSERAVKRVRDKAAWALSELDAGRDLGDVS